MVEGNETFGVTLGSSTATVVNSSVTTTITDNDVAAITLSGPTTVAEGATTSPYAVSLSGVGLGAGQSVTFTVDTASGTATEGTDFSALVSGNLTAATGVTLSGISTGANGVVTVTATNTSGSSLSTGATLLNFSIPTTQDVVPEGPETFAVTLGSSTATVVTGTVNTTITDDDKGLVVGQNVADTANQTVDHAVDNTPSNPDGPIDGTPSADVLIGDVGGTQTTVIPGQNYNIILIADTSGSMREDANPNDGVFLSRINLLKSSLTNLVNQLDDHYLTGGKVNLVLVDFDATATTRSNVVNLTQGNSQAVRDVISALDDGGGTNYEAAFNQAVSAINSLTTSGYTSSAGYQTITYFLTDGDPTYYIQSNGTRGGNGQDTTATELNESIASFSLLSPLSTVYGIGIGTGTTRAYLEYFDNTTSPALKPITVGGNPVTGLAAPVDIVTSGDQLDSILQGGSTTITVSPVGNDVINGGDGNDAILGDSIFSTSIDKGWTDFVSSNPLLTTDQAKADNIYLNLTSNNPTYAREGTVGGNDTIDGGAGNDVIFGQGGNDAIVGGSGNDVIRGGTGVDTLTGGTGADQFVFVRGEGSNVAATTEIDVITDFTLNTDTIVINGNGTNINSVVVGTPSSNVYTITVTYTGGSIEYFKVNLTNGAVLNDAPGGEPTDVSIVGTSATIDGTIVGATLYLDINQNNQEDFGERLGVTDAQGHVEWVVDLGKLDVNGDGEFTLGEARAVQSGGLDIDTGLTYEINLYGQVGASVVTPLTSLLQALFESGVGYASANATLSSRLGLPAGSDLTTLNPILGSNAILGQNAAVMTAAVQFSELAARQLGTDEAHASWTVFSSISHVLSELPEGQVADFSSASLLSAIADQLQVDLLASSDIIAFMAASQLALQHSLESLPDGADALAAVSAVQHLVQGSYAQVLGSVADGDLAVHTLDDLTTSLTAYGHGELSLDQLDSFDQQLTLAGTDGQITESEFTHAASSLPDQTDIPSLISSYLDTIAQQADSNGDGVADQSPGSAELAYHLDSMISDFIDHHGLSDGAYASIHQDLMDHLAHGINEVIPGQDQDLAFNDQGHVTDDAAVLAALDQHFQDLVDHHSSFDSVAYHDVPTPDHAGY